MNPGAACAFVVVFVFSSTHVRTNSNRSTPACQTARPTLDQRWVVRRFLWASPHWNDQYGAPPPRLPRLVATAEGSNQSRACSKQRPVAKAPVTFIPSTKASAFHFFSFQSDAAGLCSCTNACCAGGPSAHHPPASPRQAWMAGASSLPAMVRSLPPEPTRPHSRGGSETSSAQRRRTAPLG